MNARVELRSRRRAAADLAQSLELWLFFESDDLAVAIESYYQFQRKGESSGQRRQSIARWRILELLRERLLARTLSDHQASERLDALAAEVADKRRDPYSAVEEIMKEEVKALN